MKGNIKTPKTIIVDNVTFKSIKTQSMMEKLTATLKIGDKLLIQPGCPKYVHCVKVSELLVNTIYELIDKSGAYCYCGGKHIWYYDRLQLRNVNDPLDIMSLHWRCMYIYGIEQQIKSQKILTNLIK